MLSINSEIDLIKDKIAQYRIEKKSFVGVNSVPDINSIRNHGLISSIEVNDQGEVTVRATVTAKQGGEISANDHVPVEMKWTPMLQGERMSGWLCTGSPAKYMLGKCKT
jgi:hypothetical protein